MSMLLLILLITLHWMHNQTYGSVVIAFAQISFTGKVHNQGLHLSYVAMDIVQSPHCIAGVVACTSNTSLSLFERFYSNIVKSSNFPSTVSSQYFQFHFLSRQDRRIFVLSWVAFSHAGVCSSLVICYVLEFLYIFNPTLLTLSNLHCFFTSVTSCPPFTCLNFDKYIRIYIFMTIQYLKNF